jgi:16S rRNA (uracil1498-N3)-methyltransferase
MGKHRVYTSQLSIADKTIHIQGEDAWHMYGVLRLKAGDIVTLCDGAEHECEAKIVSASKDGISLCPGSITHTSTEPAIHVTLFQSIPKAEKMELIIQKCIELGVIQIIPVHTARSIPGKSNDKSERWQKIAREAARQSGRGIIPTVGRPIKINEIDGMACRHDLFLIAYEEENIQSLASVISKIPNARDIGIFIGPEGGIAPEEIAQLKSYGGTCVSLGKRILRTETAGLAMLSAIMYAYGEMGFGL